VPLTREPGKFALVRAGLVLCDKLNCSLANQRTQLEVSICCDLKQFLSDLNVENIDQGDHLTCPLCGRYASKRKNQSML